MISTGMLVSLQGFYNVNETLIFLMLKITFIIPIVFIDTSRHLYKRVCLLVGLTIYP